MIAAAAVVVAVISLIVTFSQTGDANDISERALELGERTAFHQAVFDANSGYNLTDYPMRVFLLQPDPKKNLNLDDDLILPLEDGEYPWDTKVAIEGGINTWGFMLSSGYRDQPGGFDNGISVTQRVKYDATTDSLKARVQLNGALNPLMRLEPTNPRAVHASGDWAQIDYSSSNQKNLFRQRWKETIERTADGGCTVYTLRFFFVLPPDALAPSKPEPFSTVLVKTPRNEAGKVSLTLEPNQIATLSFCYKGDHSNSNEVLDLLDTIYLGAITYTVDVPYLDRNLNAN